MNTSNKIKLDVTDLAFGMYVFELDRAWTETPFLFQGFILDDDEQIATLKAFCKYVFVDKERSSDDINFEAIPRRTVEKPAIQAEVTESIPSAARTPPPLQKKKFTTASFHQSLQQSFPIYREARGWVNVMLKDSRLGNGINTKKARAVVSHLVDEVIQNPDALTWLTHMRSRDEYTATHCINVAILSLTFGRSLGLEEEELHRLGLGALLHDLGKMQIPDAILNKPGKLTPAEFDIIKSHPQNSYDMLKNDSSLDPQVLDVVLHHHERLDGKGYPDGLVDDDISRLTRITTIVDVYDAITSDRCYHDGVTPAKALENLFSWAKGAFDADLLQGFIKCVSIYPIGTVVRLNSGESGIVVASDEVRRLKPVVLLVLNSKGEPYMPRRLVNMSSAIWENTGQMLKIDRVLEPTDLGIDMKSILINELQLSNEQITAV